MGNGIAQKLLYHTHSPLPQISHPMVPEHASMNMLRMAELQNTRPITSDSGHTIPNAKGRERERTKFDIVSKHAKQQTEAEQRSPAQAVVPPQQVMLLAVWTSRGPAKTRAKVRSIPGSRRLRLPLPLTAAYCRCRRRQDALGDHLSACPRSGLLRARGAPLERAAARVCREPGATVATNVLVRDLNVAPGRQDDRRIEVIANGLPLWGGVQVAVDTTLVSPLTAAGEPRREGRRTAGAALRHVVLGIETGGRWCPEAATFLRLLARCRARSAPPPLQSARKFAYVLRWSALLAFAAARAFATSLLSLPLSGAANVDGDPPLLSDLLAEASAPPPLASRMP